MANDPPRRIAMTADVEQYLDYALKHGVLRVRARIARLEELLAKFEAPELSQ